MDYLYITYDYENILNDILFIYNCHDGKHNKKLIYIYLYIYNIMLKHI